MNKLEKREFLIDFIKFYEGISEIDRSEDGYFLPEIDKFLELQKCTSPYDELSNVICKKCKSKTIELIKNQRSDASYQYLIMCKDCGNKIGTIRWDDIIKLV